jgi:hypothetical protein
MLYNPVARNFYRLRRVLIETLGVPRTAIRPSSRFEEVVPREQRKRVWAQFYGQNLNVEPLFPPGAVIAVVVLQLVAWIALGCVFWPGGIVVIGPIAIFVGGYACHFLKRKSIEVDPSYTLGDAALRMTTAEQCRDAGYRLTRNEIFLKVREVLVEACNLERDEITPEKTLQGDLGIE